MVRVHTKPEYQIMTPDNCHTQASAKITTKTPFQILISQQIFCAIATAYKTFSVFESSLQLNQNAATVSVHIIYQYHFKHLQNRTS